MFMLSGDAKYIDGVLAETGCLSIGQVCRLLRLDDRDKTVEAAESVVRQLCYTSRAVRLPGDVVMPLYLDRRDADPDMLIAVDIMLDLLRGRPAALTAKKPPFKLVFVTRHDIPPFTIAVVRPGQEREYNRYFDTCADEITVIFLLSEQAQAGLISIRQPHYFAVMDNGKPRYFKGA